MDLRRAATGLATVTMTVGLFAYASDPLRAQSDTFLEISRHVVDIDAEFDDDIILRSASYLWNIPALEEEEGLGFAIGGSPDGTDGTITFRYLRADPRTTSVLGDTVAAYRSYDFDFYFAPWLKPGTFTFSPLIRLGTGYTTLTIPGSVTDGTEVRDGSFGSLGLHLGGGGIVRIANWVQVTVDYTRRYLKFRSAKGFGDSIRIDEGLSATSDVLAIGLGVYVPYLR